jgi:transcriptional regulator with XRE-family HTH domain
LKGKVKDSSQAKVSRDLGIGVATINRYLKGIGEPSQETLERIADYLDRSVAWLRGETEFDERRFGQAEWDDTRDIFEFEVKQLRDLIELYGLAPEHTKDTIMDFLHPLQEDISLTFKQYPGEFSKKEIKEVSKIVTEAAEISKRYAADHPSED